MKSNVLTADAPTDKSSSYISSLREEIEYLSEENLSKTLIIKQVTEIKTTVNPTNTLVICNENSIDKTTQNSNNVIDKNIKNNNQEILKNKKSTNKNLPNTKTLNTTDALTNTCFGHPISKKTQAQTKKTRWKLTKRKTRKRRKKIIAMGLQIGRTTTRTETIRIKRMFIFLVTTWFKN